AEARWWAECREPRSNVSWTPLGVTRRLQALGVDFVVSKRVERLGNTWQYVPMLHSPSVILRLPYWLILAVCMVLPAIHIRQRFVAGGPRAGKGRGFPVTAVKHD